MPVPEQLRKYINQCINPGKPGLLWLAALVGCYVMSNLSSCRPADESFEKQPAAVQTSTDTLLFDTVFTELRTVTRNFWVYNRNSGAVNLTVRLVGGSSSPFSIVANGQRQPLTELFVRGNDSILVLAEATIDPVNDNLPVIVEDEILLQVQGAADAKVALVAYGQDANYIRTSEIGCNEIWRAGKPYIIMNNRVELFTNAQGEISYGTGTMVPDGCTLTIEDSAKVHFYNGAGLYFRNSNLVVNGHSTQHPVLFTSVRSDDFYELLPGQWGSIYALGDANINMQYAVIENGTFGLQSEPIDANTPTLLIDKTIIRQMSGLAIFCFNSTLQVTNSLLYDCASGQVAGLEGGSYSLFYNTLAYSGRSFLNFRREEEQASLIFTAAGRKHPCFSAYSSAII